LYLFHIYIHYITVLMTLQLHTFFISL
jgi:hypothetical protein